MNRLDRAKQKRILQIDLNHARQALQDGIPRLRAQLASIETLIHKATEQILASTHKSEEQLFYIAERSKLMTERRMVHEQMSGLIKTERDIFTDWTRHQ